MLSPSHPPAVDVGRCLRACSLWSALLISTPLWCLGSRLEQTAGGEHQVSLNNSIYLMQFKADASSNEPIIVLSMHSYLKKKWNFKCCKNGLIYLQLEWQLRLIYYFYILLLLFAFLSTVIHHQIVL